MAESARMKGPAPPTSFKVVAGAATNFNCRMGVIVALRLQGKRDEGRTREREEFVLGIRSMENVGVITVFGRAREYH